MVNNLSFKVKDEFVSLLPVSDAKAQNIFNVLIHFFTSNSIPYKTNLIGFASDGANTMFGHNHSVKKLLEDEISDLFVLKCMCHSLALCASYSCEKISNYVEDLVRVYTYMKYSYKRQCEFSEFQSFVEAKPNTLLQPSQTRWLSLLSRVKRIIEQYSALELYFREQYPIDKKSISNLLQII